MNGNKMKPNGTLLLFAFFAIAIVAQFAQAAPKLELVGVVQNATVVRPGDTFTVRLDYTNLETDCAKYVDVQLSTAYPFYVKGLDTQYLAKMCQENDSFSFPVQVDSLAQSGTYPISAMLTYQSGIIKYSDANTLGIQVSGTPDAAISVIASNPIDIYPGDTATLTLSVVDNGSAPITTGSLHIESVGPQIKWAGKDVQISQIQAHGSAQYSVSVEVSKDLPSGNYPLVVTLNYASDDNVLHQSQFSFQMPVKPKAEFIANQSASSPLVTGESRKVSIVLSNTGSQEARKLKVAIRPVYPFGTDGTIRYVESLMPGQSVSLDFYVNVDKDASTGSQIVGLNMDYEDPQGKQMSDSIDLSLTVRDKTQTELAYSYWYVFAIVAVALVMFVRGMLAKKKK